MLYVKKAQDMDIAGGMGTAYNLFHPKLGDLMHAVMMENSINDYNKRIILEGMTRDVGYLPPQTPLSHGLLSAMGGGFLGMMIARMLGAGFGGTLVGTAGMAALAKVISDYYLNEDNMKKNGIRVIT